MIRVIDYGPTLKRPKSYFKTKCTHCKAELVFEYNDIWWEDPVGHIGRVECPVCRTKTFFEAILSVSDAMIGHIDYASTDEYENAYKDTSKRGIIKLMEEKEKEANNG